MKEGAEIERRKVALASCILIHICCIRRWQMEENKAAAHVGEVLYRNLRGRRGFHDVNQPAASISPPKL